MTPLHRVFSKTNEFFWQYPLLWLPVLIADTCRYGVMQVEAPIRRAVIFALMPRSVLGGYAGPENRPPIASLIAGGAIEWSGYLFSIVAYLYAMGVLARVVGGVQRGLSLRTALTWAIPAKMMTALGRALSCVLLAVFGFGFVMYGMSQLGLPLIYSFMGLVIVILIFVVTGPLRAFVEANASEQPPLSKNRWTDYALLIFSASLAVGISVGSQDALQHDRQLAAISSRLFWYPVSLVLSLFSAMPYVFMMIGLALREDEYRPTSIPGSEDQTELEPGS